MTSTDTTPAERPEYLLTAEDVTPEAGSAHAESLFRTGEVVVTADQARQFSQKGNGDFWIAYADRLDELQPQIEQANVVTADLLEHSTYVRELEDVAARALRAQSEVQRMWDRYARDPSPTLRRVTVLRDVQRALAAFAGE